MRIGGDIMFDNRDKETILKWDVNWGEWQCMCCGSHLGSVHEGQYCSQCGAKIFEKKKILAGVK